jgi:hypothetical protein
MRFSRPLPIAVGFSLVLLGSVADAASTTCSTSTVCAEFINSSSGVAIHGEANSGIGIRGTSNTSTGFYGASRSGSTFFPGVEGESLNQTGDDAAGAFGLTAASGGAAPAFGVLAYGSAYGVYGDAAGNGTNNNSTPTSVGVFGLDSGGATAEDSNVGVLGKTKHGTAVLAMANVSSVNDYIFSRSVYGVLGDAEPEGNLGAYGVQGISSYVAVDAYNPGSGNEVQLANASELIYGGSGAFVVDDSGNIVARSLVTSKGSYARTTGSSGTARMVYAAHTTSPITEDFGEGQLVNGRGYVRLDPALADVIDNRNAYHVFLTPEGDSKGLYVTEKTPAGFVVRESSGGRSTLSFEYRILAKPVDENGVRLALAPPLLHAVSPMQRLRARNAPATEPLDPFARLKQKLGPAAYARALKAARLVERGP